jgi:hypothetical protein
MSIRTLLLLSTVAIVGVGCSEETPMAPTPVAPAPTPDPEPTPPPPLTVPTTYNFDSRFNTGESSVGISGQIARQLQLQDLKILIGGLSSTGAAAVTVADLNGIYDYADTGLSILTTVPDGLTASATTYEGVSTGKKMRGRQGTDKVLLGSAGIVGNAADITVDELMQSFFTTIAANAADASKLGTKAVYNTADGLDLSQMVNKVLIGAILFDQLSSKYLADILDRDNTVARSDGADDTVQEHRFDEAFGYFGGARDYSSYTDIELAGSLSDYAKDSNSDGTLDFTTEYNFGLSRNAGKRDKGGTGVDFTDDIFSAFLAGRTAIVNGDMAALATHRKAVSEGFEKVIAATAVHYINDSMDDMATLTADEITNKNNYNLNKHWGEMKGFTFALQFGYRGDATGGPMAIISEASVIALHALMGNAPVYAAVGSTEADAYLADLQSAKDILKSAYGFSDANMAGW